MKESFEDFEMDDGIRFCCGNQNAFMRDRANSMEAVKVSVRKENEELIGILILLDETKQLGGVGALFVHPFDFVCFGMRILQKLILKSSESVGISFLIHRESADHDSVDFFNAGWINIPPGDVILSATGEHFHFHVPCQVFGNIAAMKLRPAVNFESIPLDYKCDAHS